jgi:4-hydroxy-tetrahydrodipicolinate synthase
MTDLQGICVPICTPFSSDGSALDEAALRNHLDSMIEAGVHVIAVCGGTGEFPFLTEAEKRRIAEVSAKHIDGRTKLIVQTSAIRTEDAIEASRHAEANGADALLVRPPDFEGPGADGVLWHYERVARSVDTTIMAYNIPQYSGFDITPEIFAQLRQFGTVRYIKDSTGDMLRLEQLAQSGAKVFNGCDYLNLYALMAGSVGCFSGAANAMPSESVKLYELVEAGHLDDALALWRRMQPLNLFLWTYPFNPVAKEASNISGRPVGECRRPVLPLSEAQKVDLNEAMSLLMTG